MGRFGAFKDWRWSHDTLHDAIACACIAMNVEMFLSHGDEGRYAKSTPDYVAEVHAKAERHTQQDQRYPEYEPLEPLPRRAKATAKPTKRQRSTKRPVSQLHVGGQTTMKQVIRKIMTRTKMIQDKKKKEN